MESHHVAAGSRGFGRWGSAEFRRPPGHRKQGGWHMFAEESGHGYMPSRSADQLMEEESRRRSTFRVDGKYNRMYRDNGASFGQRDWKGASSWEDGNGRPMDVCNSQRSVDGLTHTSCRRMFTEESGHGYMRSRSADKLMEEESGRRSTFRGDGKYNRNYRDNRGSFGQRDWKGANSWENSNGRLVDVSNNQRSMDGLAHSSCRHMFAEESGHGYMPSRSADKLMEEESGRRSTFRGDGKYNRNYRDNKGSFGQRVWKGTDSWENSNGRPIDVSNNQRSVDEFTHTSLRHMLAEESGHAYMPSRSTDRLTEEEGGRRSNFRGDGKYNRNYRENKGSLRQRNAKDAKSSENSSGKPIDVCDNQRSIDGPTHTPTHTSCSQFDIGNACDSDQMPSKEHHDVPNDANVTITGQKIGKDNSLVVMDWKPLKWSRPGSLSSRSSGLSHSSSSKSMGGSNSGEEKDGTVAKDITPVTTPAVDVVTCVTSASIAEEMNAKKKPRLGWGEGLAKYEKKKVEGGDEVAPKLAEPVHSLSVSHASKSPILTGISECASPATPSSVACSSSPGLEDKSFPKNSNGDSDMPLGNLCQSPGLGSHDLLGGFSLYLEKMDAGLIANLGHILVEMLQSEDPYLVESGFMRSPALKKLFLWRSDVGRALELTEFEIDSLENELKSLITFSRGDDQRAESSSSLAEAQERSDYNKVCRPAPLEIVDMDEATLPPDDGRVKQIYSTCKDEDVDSPGSATSKYNEPTYLTTAVSAETSQQPMDLDNIDAAVSSEEGRRRVDDLNTTGHKAAEPSSSTGDVMIPEVIGDHCGISESKNDDLLKDGSMTTEDSTLSEFIIATNKETARKASEVLDKLLPDDKCKLNIASTADATSLQIDPLILREFTMRKRFSRFKEKVVALKYKAFDCLWKEDMRQLALRKCRVKSQKKLDSGLRVNLNGYQKHRSSIRSRFSSCGNLSPVSPAETANCTSKLLLDSQITCYRKNLTMPALILDDREKFASRFITTNGLIEDPCALEKERKMINPWTMEEREIFLDKLATFGKDFRKIASFLDHKTTADCVEFYYKNHKSDCFERTMRKLDSGKRGKSLSTNTYLKTSEKRWTREVNPIPLEVLGAASVIASQADDKMLERDVNAVPFIGVGCNNSRLSRIDCGDDTSSFDVLGSEREAVAADVLAGICGSLSSEAMSSCVTSSIDLGERGRTRTDFIAKRPLTPDLAENVEEETCSGESCGEMDPSDWTDEEKSDFIRALSAYGKDFAIISRIVGTRSLDQCKVFFSKARKCLGLDLLHPKTSINGTSFSNDANGGDSDLEDACGLETSSAVCDDHSGSKMDEDSRLPGTDAAVAESVLSKSVNLQPDLNKTYVNAGMQCLDAKDVKVGVADACMSKDGQSLSASPGFHKSEATLIDADGMEDLATVGLAACQVVAPVNEHAECKPASSAPLDHKLASQVCPGAIKDSLPGEESVETCGAPTTDHGTTIVGLRKDSCSSCITADAAPALELSLKSKPKLKVSLGVTSVEVPPDSLLQQSSHEIARSVSQECNIIPAVLDRVSVTTVDLPVGRQLRNEDRSKLVSGNPSLSSYECVQILRGCPVQMPGQEMKGNSHCGKVSAVPIFIKAEDSVGHQYIPQDGIFGKCSATKSNCSVAELPLLPQKSEQPNHPPSVLGQRSLEKEQNKEKPSGAGDFKLFGQILSHPPSNLNSKSTEENGVNQKVGSKSSVLKPCSNHGEDRNSPLSKFENSNSATLENVPLRSYGFWDGSRIQTGFSSLPDSALLLAKYPAAFSSYPMSSAKLEQLQLQALAKSNECHLNGLSVFTSREVASSNGIMDYLTLRSREDAKVQPFTIDVKQQRQDACPDIPRSNGFETIPSLQQHQARGGMIAMNVVGRGGVVVGGPCNSISDPVAAIKMHYAQSEPYVGQNVNVIREDEPWRSNGDLGR